VKTLDLTLDPATLIERDFQGLFSGSIGLSSIAGGQTAADAALANLDISGYAAKRSEVLPRSARGASVLSPYIRHNLLTLPEVFAAVAKAPYQDREKFRDELYWQEYARHLYARVGVELFQNLRYDARWSGGRGAAASSAGSADLGSGDLGSGWSREMACVDSVLTELETDGWLVNQTRMWLASDFTVRNQQPWPQGQELMHRELIDGSRAANLLGWQWTVGAGTGKPYGFARWQVEKRAPGLCSSCPLKTNCPIQEFPAEHELAPVSRNPLLDSDPDPRLTAGPMTPLSIREPEVVLLTIDSLGDRDAALSANPELPVAFVFNESALAKLQLSARRIGFYLETLQDLAQRRDLSVYLGDPYQFAESHDVAVTFAPVPSFKKFIRIAQLHPYPWLAAPHSGSVRSFTSWRKQLR
jgi:deoxyribodipyrimidine photo-lyase